MMNAYESQPLESAEELAKTLREHGLSSEEAAQLAPELMALKGWPAPAPTRAETEQLIEHLVPYVPAVSPVRRAVRERRRSLWDEFAGTVQLARIQVSILRPSFWSLSALVTLLGALLLLSRTSSNEALVLLAIGPLWSYLGAVSAFRGMELKVLELELACPPSPRQLMIARLVIVLGYDLLLGLALSLLLWSHDEETLWALTSHWLAPLLLVAGVTLLLSLRISIERAAGAAYGGWLTVLLLIWLVRDTGGIETTFTAVSEGMLALIGLVCLAFAIRYSSIAMPRMLPRHI